MCVDAENRVVSTPAYMRNSPIHVVRDGINNMIGELLKMLQCSVCYKHLTMREESTASSPPRPSVLQPCGAVFRCRSAHPPLLSHRSTRSCSPAIRCRSVDATSSRRRGDGVARPSPPPSALRQRHPVCVY